MRRARPARTLLVAALGPALVQGLLLAPPAAGTRASAGRGLPQAACPSRMARSVAWRAWGPLSAQRLREGGDAPPATQKQAVGLLYFVVFSALACQGRFLSLFFRDSLGLTNQQIGRPPLQARGDALEVMCDGHGRVAVAHPH